MSFREDVRDFIELFFPEYEKRRRENEDLKLKLSRCKNELSEYKNLENEGFLVEFDDWSEDIVLGTNVFEESGGVLRIGVRYTFMTSWIYSTKKEWNTIYKVKKVGKNKFQGVKYVQRSCAGDIKCRMKASSSWFASKLLKSTKKVLMI